MRESGFDPSNRFGPFSVDIVHHAARLPERAPLPDGDGHGGDPAHARRREGGGRLDGACLEATTSSSTGISGTPTAGLYFDYNFKTRQRRRYEFATTFYPLWAGIASPEQAARVVKNLPLFEAPGGLLTSTADHRQPVGRALRLGSAAAHRRGRPAPRRLSGGRGPRGPEVHRPRGQGVRRARHDRGEVRRRAARNPTCPPASASAIPATRSASAGRTPPSSSSWPGSRGGRRAPRKGSPEHPFHTSRLFLYDSSPFLS